MKEIIFFCHNQNSNSDPYLFSTMPIISGSENMEHGDLSVAGKQIRVEQWKVWDWEEWDQEVSLKGKEEHHLYFTNGKDMQGYH